MRKDHPPKPDAYEVCGHFIDLTRTIPGHEHHQEVRLFDGETTLSVPVPVFFKALGQVLDYIATEVKVVGVARWIETCSVEDEKEVVAAVFGWQRKYAPARRAIR